MRGSNDVHSYLVVPFTRGRERSLQFDSIASKVKHLIEAGFVKEVVLLVNSWNDR